MALVPYKNILFNTLLDEIPLDLIYGIFIYYSYKEYISIHTLGGLEKFSLAFQVQKDSIDKIYNDFLNNHKKIFQECCSLNHLFQPHSKKCYMCRCDATHTVFFKDESSKYYCFRCYVYPLPYSIKVIFIGHGCVMCRDNTYDKLSRCKLCHDLKNKKVRHWRNGEMIDVWLCDFCYQFILKDWDMYLSNTIF